MTWDQDKDRTALLIETKYLTKFQMKSKSSFKAIVQSIVSQSLAPLKMWGIRVISSVMSYNLRALK